MVLGWNQVFLPLSQEKRKDINGTFCSEIIWYYRVLVVAGLWDLLVTLWLIVYIQQPEYSGTNWSNFSCKDFRYSKKPFWIADIQSLNLFITFKFSWGQDNSLELKPEKKKKKKAYQSKRDASERIQPVGMFCHLKVLPYLSWNENLQLQAPVRPLSVK